MCVQIAMCPWLRGWPGTRSLAGMPLRPSTKAYATCVSRADGQTGSGKTYTMGEISKLGTPDEGVSHRMIRALYALSAQETSMEYSISMQYVQVHLERVFDLFATPGARETSLQLREDRLRGVYVEVPHPSLELA